MNVVADTVILVLVFATLAQAWSWLGSYAGIVSLGHGIFFGIGGYAVAVSNLRGGSPWYGALGGALFAVICAAVCGALVLRGRGLVFTVMTLAAGIAAEPLVAAQHWVGPGNAFVFPIRPGFLNLQFSEKWPYVLLAFAVFSVTQGLTLVLRSTKPGFALRTIRGNPAGARGLGIAARPLQLIALAASAFVTSVAGSFFAQYTGAVDPQHAFALAPALDVALIALLAGPAWAWGAPLAALGYVLADRIVPLHPPGSAGVAVLVIEGLLIGVLALLRAPDALPRLRRTRAVRPQAAA